MALLAQFVLFILCLLMFIVNRRYKFAILILSTICFSFVTLSIIPFGNGKYILPNCFLVSELPHIVKHFKNIKSSIIWKILVIALITFFVHLLNSPHYNDSLKNILNMFINDFFDKYLVLGYAFICITTERDLLPAMKVSYYGLIVLTFFAFINYITGHADFVNELGRGMATNDMAEALGDKFTYSDRFRVQAMFFNPFDYGYICICMLILHYVGYLKGLLSNKRFYISIVCCLFGMVTCGCRTVIVCAFLALISYILLSMKLRKSVKYLLCLCIVGLIAYGTIPYVRDKVDSTMTAFDTESDYGGSSLQMRTLQYATVLTYMDGYEWFGRGKGYFQIDLGWKDGKSGLVDKDLHGLEGVLMGLLLESGIVGVVFYLIIYGFLFYYLWQYRNVDKQLASLSISVFVAYFSFANMTGELGSVCPTLLVIGGFLGILYNKGQHLQVMDSQNKVPINSNL